MLGLCLNDAKADLLIEVPAGVQKLLSARELKDFARSDELRDEILAAGFVVLDTADGQTVKKT